MKRDFKDRSGPRDASQFIDGTTLGLEALHPVDLSEPRTVGELVAAMKHTAFGGRQLGEAADVLHEMVTDPECLVVGTFSGAMTVAKQGLVLCEMIERGMVDIVVSTGAFVAHGLVESAGMTHFKAPTHMSDREMFYAGFDRVYDTLELEKNLDDLEVVVDEVLSGWPEGETACSSRVCRRIGRHLNEHTEGRGILKAAVDRGVPVYVPAFTDSELGLDFAVHNHRRRGDGRRPIPFDPFLDLEDYASRCDKATRMGIFTIGGGVPRNWAQQVAPFLDLVATRLGARGRNQRFRYGVRICPEPAHWGGLSGCTYAEGVSWGKFVPPGEGGRWAEVPSDATIAWPILVAAVLERMRARE